VPHHVLPHRRIHTRELPPLTTATPKAVFGSPRAFRAGCKASLSTFDASRGLPCLVRNRNSIGFQHTPSAPATLFCLPRLRERPFDMLPRSYILGSGRLTYFSEQISGVFVLGVSTHAAPRRMPSSDFKYHFTSPGCAFGRSRPAADATREVVERWLLDGLM
jgi:hypothetical protein